MQNFHPLVFIHVDLTNSFPLNCLLSKSKSLPSCINMAPIPCSYASHLAMNFLPKSSVSNTGVEYIASFKSENAKVTSSFHSNEVFLKIYVSGPTMHAYFLKYFL
jgi:hypothetical protein